MQVITLHYARPPSIGTCVVDCGAKCCRAPGHVVVTEAEAQVLRALDKRGRVRFVKHEKRGMLAMNFKEHCVFLNPETNLCTIYERRPRGCSQFPTRPVVDCLVWPKEG